MLSPKLTSPAHRYPCLRFGRATPRDTSRKTEGQDGSHCLLSCGTLSFLTACRFIPALTLVNADVVTNGSNAYDVKIQRCIIESVHSYV